MTLRYSIGNLRGLYDLFFYDRWSYIAVLPLSALIARDFYNGKPVDWTEITLLSLLALATISSRRKTHADERQSEQDETDFLAKIRRRREATIQMSPEEVKNKLLGSLDRIIGNYGGMD